MQVHTSFFCIFCFLYVVCLLFYAIGGLCFRYMVLVKVCAFFVSRRCVCGTWENLLYYSAVKDYLTTAI